MLLENYLATLVLCSGGSLPTPFHLGLPLPLWWGLFTLSSGPATFPGGLPPNKIRWTPKALAAPGAGGLFPLTLASWAAPTGLLPLFLFQMKTHVPNSKAEAQGVPGFSQQHWSRGM